MIKMIMLVVHLNKFCQILSILLPVIMNNLIAYRMNNATNDAENAMENAEESKSGEVCDGLSERLKEVELR